MNQVEMLLETAAGLWKALRRTTRLAVAQALLTALFLAAGYVGVFMVRDRSIAKGLGDAFAAIVAPQPPVESQAMLQTEMHQLAASDRVLRQALQTALDQATGAARVRLAIIHNGVMGITGSALLRYDMTHAVAAAGRSVGPIRQNATLSEFAEFINTLLANQCALVDGATVQSASYQALLEAMATRYVLACPAQDFAGLLLGVVLIYWDKREDMPPPTEISRLMDKTRDLGRRIGAALELRPPPT